MPTLNLPHQNRLRIGTKPAFSFWINISTVSEVRCDSQGLGLVARIEASILVFDIIQVLYWPVWGQIQFCSFDRRCKTCYDTKPVLYQGRFCSLTDDRHTPKNRKIQKYRVTAVTIIIWFSSIERQKSNCKPVVEYFEYAQNIFPPHDKFDIVYTSSSSSCTALTMVCILCLSQDCRSIQLRLYSDPCKTVVWDIYDYIMICANTNSTFLGLTVKLNHAYRILAVRLA